MALTVSTLKKMKDSAQTVNNNGASKSGTTSNAATSGTNKNTGTTTTTTAKTNSPYTSPSLGNTWNASTDYQAIINNAVANGDYVTAAKAEQFRNQKINATGSNYNTTNMYSGYLNTDYGTLGQQQMANGASWQDVLATYNSRNNKASTTAGLEKYANDDIQQMMWNYIQDNMKSESQQEAQDQYNKWLTEYEQNNPKEEYNGKYDSQIDALLSQILNRDDFSYDAMNDPLYQQYAKMYQREGDRAMKETMAEAAAGAGGMNTYAMTAAMQANNYYNSQLNDRIPELYQLAYNMYLQDKESKVQDLGLLQNMDATQYSRYRDTINDYYKDKNFAYGAYYDALQQGNWLTNQNYNSMVDNRNWNNDQYWANKEWDYNDEWKNKEYTDNRADIEYERTQAEEDEAKALIDWYIQNGVSTIDPALIAKAGLTQTAVNEAVANFKAQQAEKAKSSSSRSGGSGGGDDEGGDDGKIKDPEDEGTKDPEKEPEKESTPDPEKWSATENYKDIDEACKGLLMTKGKNEVLAYLKRTLEEGAIDIYSYMTLVNKYRG